MSRKRREVTIETERILFIKRSPRRPILWCDCCAQEVVMLTVDEAATMARMASRMIFRLVEAGQLHFTETPEGRLLVCSNSLP